MPRVGFEPTIAAGERPYTYALDRAAAGTGHHADWSMKYTGRLHSVAVALALKS